MRIFVRSIAQIQVPTVAATGRLVHRHQQVTTALPASACKSFHTACVRLSEAPSETEALNHKEAMGSRSPLVSFAAQAKPSGSLTENPKETKGRPKGLRNKSDKPGGPVGRSKKEKPATRPGRPAEYPNAEKIRQKFIRASEEKRTPSLMERIAEEHNQGRDAESWKIQKAALKEKFPEGWKPRKRLSPDALAGIRALHVEFPEEYTSEVLANKFQVSPEAIRRILRSKWNPSHEEEIGRQERWFRRGKSVWSRWAAMGVKPPRKWRAAGITRDPIWNEKKRSQDDEDKKARARAHNRLSQTLL